MSWTLACVESQEVVRFKTRAADRWSMVGYHEAGASCNSEAREEVGRGDFTSIPDSVLFWAADVLTRSQGATLGDTLTKPHTDGGLALGRIISSLAMAAAMVILIALTSRRRRVQTA
jgi:hypothetical protein